MRPLALALLSLAPAALCQKPAPKPPVQIQILAINDFHGNLEPPAGSDGLINKTFAGGAEYLATDLAAAARQNPNTLLVAAGDLFGASPLLSGLSRDQPAIASLNAMHLDLTSIGNHELDHGPAELRLRLKDAHFHYLAANVVDDPAHPSHTLFPSTAIRTVGGVRIGFIGETLKATDAMIGQDSSRGLTFLEEAAVANQAAADLERQGVHTIVLLIHQGGEQHVPPGTDRDPNGCASFGGALTEVLDHLAPSIKVVISAHTHQFYKCTLAGRSVTSASSYGRMFTRIQLSVDPATDTLLHSAATNVVVTRDVPRDPTQTAIIQKYRIETDHIRNHIEGSVAASITKQFTPAGESPMGDLIADAELAAAQLAAAQPPATQLAATQPAATQPASAPDGGPAVIAFMNTGGIRADLTVPAGTPAPHPVTFGDLYTAQPFGNRITVFTLTGELLRRVLEQQFDVAPGDNLQLLQVSEGFAYSYRPNAPAGEHILSMTLHGQPIDPADQLRIAATDYVAQGTEHLPALRERTGSITLGLDLDALIAYFGSHSPVAPPATNRITRVD